MSENDAKTGHLVLYDYGTGGLWAYVYAHSRDEISRKYPKLTIVENRPAWMSDETYDLISSVNAFAIGDEPPEWLKIAMNENQ
jgi:hypothetical protein